MFEADLQRVERALDVPYPERALLVRELEADLGAAYQALRDGGADHDAAVGGALAELGLDEEAMRSLAAVHNPAVRRALLCLSPPARERLEWVFASIPVVLFLFNLFREVPMLHFLHEGGAAAPVTLAIGVIALLFELHRGLLWFVLRDHSARALQRNTATPLYLAAAAFLSGLLGTATSYYVVLDKWAQGAIPADALRVGLREPLPNIIVGAALATLVVLIHGAMQAGLRTLSVPAT